MMNYDYNHHNISALFWDGSEGEPIGFECEREQVRRSGPSELMRRGGHGEPQQEDGTRRPTNRTHTIIMRAAMVFFAGIFYEAVVQLVPHVTEFCKVGRRVVYPSWGTTTRKCQFSGTGIVAALQPVKQLGKARRSPIIVLWFLVRLPFFHSMPAGRQSDSTPHSRRVRLCSQLPCGSHGAGSLTAVVCSRELVS